MNHDSKLDLAMMAETSATNPEKSMISFVPKYTDAWKIVVHIWLALPCHFAHILKTKEYRGVLYKEGQLAHETYY